MFKNSRKGWEQDTGRGVEPTVKFKFTSSCTAETSARSKLQLSDEHSGSFQRVSRERQQAHTYFLAWMEDLAGYTSLGHAAYPIWAWDYNRCPEEGGKK